MTTIYLVEWIDGGSRCMEAFADDQSALLFVSDNLPKLPKLHKLYLRGSVFVDRPSVNQELLNALRGVVRVADRETVEFDAARLAIARATET